MRKLLFSFNITMDGFVDHHAVVADDELHEIASELFRTADLVLFGRVVYELFASSWPTAEDDKTLSASVREFANLVNRVPKAVYSRTQEKVDWNTKIERELDPRRVLDMKTQPGKNILLAGGASIARAFMKYGLIDEYRFLVQPIMLGHGKRLFDDDGLRQDLSLISTRTLNSGWWSWSTKKPNWTANSKGELS